MDFEHKVRKNVKRARRSGVRVELDEDGARLDDFVRIYEHTLERRDAPAGYRFPRGFFERIGARLRGQFVYVHALHEGRVVSSELALVSERNVYSFLGGTDADAYELRPNDLLKHELILWAKRAGKRRFVLGGGYRPDDGIFRYKRSFAPRSLVAFEVGHRILDAPLYRELCARAGVGEAGAFFPAYRG
jgi:lipid II:glycine glycyltransferase (peptidoglycan interpeptide bridge formation enzyme)